MSETKFKWKAPYDETLSLDERLDELDQWILSAVSFLLMDGSISFKEITDFRPFLDGGKFAETTPAQLLGALGISEPTQEQENEILKLTPSNP